MARPSRPATELEAETIARGVRDLLSSAELAARGQIPKHYRVLTWWRGTSIDAASRYLQEAESQLARLYDDNEVEAEVPNAVARTDIGLYRDDPRREAARQLLTMESGPAKRTLLSKTIEIGYESVASSLARLRSFRNIVLLTTLLVSVLVAVIVLVGYYPPWQRRIVLYLSRAA